MKKLIIADIVLLFLSKLSKIPAALFALLGKIPFLGFVFRFISKLFLTFGKLLTIPFYILTAVLIIMLLLKLLKNFKKKKSRGAVQTATQTIVQPEQTSAEYARQRNREYIEHGDPNRMNIFKD